MVGIGIVGVGYWGPNLVRSFLSLPDCGPVRVCDAKPGRLQYIQQQFPPVEVTSSYDDLLADPRLDAICIVTPVSTHKDLALRALDSGRHVLVEKPLAPTADQARALVDRAAARSRILAVGHLFVYHPGIVYLRDQVAAGQLGKICSMESERVNLGPPASEVDVVWDLGVHDVSIALYLADQEPVEVTAFAGRYVHPSLLDMALLVIRYEGGALSHHHVSWLSPIKLRRFFAAGSAGSALFDLRQDPRSLTIYDRGFDSRIGARDDQAVELKYGAGEVRVPELPAAEPLMAECRHFLECIRDGTQPRAGGLEGLRVVQVLEAAEQSIARGSAAVTLPRGSK